MFNRVSFQLFNPAVRVPFGSVSVLKTVVSRPTFER